MTPLSTRESSSEFIRSSDVNPEFQFLVSNSLLLFHTSVLNFEQLFDSSQSLTTTQTLELSPSHKPLQLSTTTTQGESISSHAFKAPCTMFSSVQLIFFPLCTITVLVICLTAAPFPGKITSLFSLFTFYITFNLLTYLDSSPSWFRDYQRSIGRRPTIMPSSSPQSWPYFLEHPIIRRSPQPLVSLL